MIAWLRALPWVLVLLACGTLGLAPFSPQPHVVEKLGLLFHGMLARPIDWFDLVLHGSPWLLLFGKLAVLARERRRH